MPIMSEWFPALLFPHLYIYSATVLWHGSTTANLGGHAVQRQAHLAGEGQALVFVRPRGEDEEAPFGTCLVELMPRTGELVEAPGGEEDERQPRIEHRPHHRLLSFGYGGRHEDGSASCSRQHPLDGLRHLLVGEAPRALHLHLLGVLQQEAVADGGVGLAADGQVEAHPEVLGMPSAHRQSPRVLVQVLKPAVQFTIPFKDVVVVVAGEKEACGGGCFGGCFFCRNGVVA